MGDQLTQFPRLGCLSLGHRGSPCQYCAHSSLIDRLEAEETMNDSEEKIALMALRRLIHDQPEKVKLFDDIFTWFPTSKYDPWSDLVAVCAFCEQVIVRIRSTNGVNYAISALDPAYVGTNDAEPDPVSYTEIARFHATQCALSYWSKLP